LKKLVSSSEAAQILGLSLQGVHYRIKKGQLESVKKDGKIFVYIDSKISKPTQIYSSSNSQGYDKLLEVKDEQIQLLKKTIKFFRKQKDTEIARLERQQNKIMDVFQSEVDLLKSAFNEMRTLYKISDNNSSIAEYNIQQEEQYNSSAHEEFTFMDIKDFFIFMREHNKTDSQIKSMLLEKIKNGDKRFIYKKKTKEIIIYKSDFLDLI
jgi:hypothetical protein